MESIQRKILWCHIRCTKPSASHQLQGRHITTQFLYSWLQ